jgi:hypothetical protein
MAVACGFERYLHVRVDGEMWLDVLYRVIARVLAVGGVLSVPREVLARSRECGDRAEDSLEQHFNEDGRSEGEARLVW